MTKPRPNVSYTPMVSPDDAKYQRSSIVPAQRHRNRVSESVRVTDRRHHWKFLRLSSSLTPREPRDRKAIRAVVPTRAEPPPFSPSWFQSTRRYSQRFWRHRLTKRRTVCMVTSRTDRGGSHSHWTFRHSLLTPAFGVFHRLCHG